VSIRTAVIAVAGFGTRFLPATKALPKEMLPILDRPAVQYLVEEAAAAGIDEVILVTRPGADIFEKHFSPAPNLESHLREQGKQEFLRRVQAAAALAKVTVIGQPAELPYGNGSPLLAAADHLRAGEPFVFMFGDDLVLSKTPCVQQLVDTFSKHQPAGIVAVQEVPRVETKNYGIVALEPGSDPPRMQSIVEKPKVEDAPSNLAQFGRFVFTPRIIELLQARLRDKRLGKDGELYLADAIADLCREDRVLVQRIEGTWHTTGDPLAMLKTSIAFALADPAYGESMREFLLDQASRLRQ
jgi:UTP--glucose-1-phosphate uridylyltransferase